MKILFFSLTIKTIWKAGLRSLQAFENRIKSTCLAILLLPVPALFIYPLSTQDKGNPGGFPKCSSRQTLLTAGDTVASTHRPGVCPHGITVQWGRRTLIKEINYRVKLHWESGRRDAGARRAQSKWDSTRRERGSEKASLRKWLSSWDLGVRGSTQAMGVRGGCGDKCSRWRQQSVRSSCDGALMFPEPHIKIRFILLHGHVGIPGVVTGKRKMASVAQV